MLTCYSNNNMRIKVNKTNKNKITEERYKVKHF